MTENELWRRVLGGTTARARFGAAGEYLTDLGWRLRLRRPPGVVLWGGRECDRQVGSKPDLLLAAHARRIAMILHARQRQTTGLIQLNITLRDAFTPAVKQAAEAMQKMAAKMATTAQERQALAAAALGRARPRPPEERS